MDLWSTIVEWVKKIVIIAIGLIIIYVIYQGLNGGLDKFRHDWKQNNASSVSVRVG